MNKHYWLTRWKVGNLHFNQAEPHDLLIKHFPLLNTQPHDQIFVPLCGKSVDMIWLMQQKQNILGVELSSIAIDQFAEENQITFKKHAQGDYTIYEAPSCTIYNGDLFDLETDLIKNVSVIYDRACLTAFPPETLGKKYLEWIKVNFPANCKMLLICIDHNNKEIALPPFITTKTQLKECFGPEFSIQLLEQEEHLESTEHWKEKGIHEWTEYAYLIEKNPI